jgi:hypothetical protein
MGWGMVAGDANGDGRIHDMDAIIASNQIGMAGYHRGDFNLDGYVSETNDIWAFWGSNRWTESSINHRETLLTPALKIEEPIRTISGSSTNLINFSGITGLLHWHIDAPEKHRLTVTPVGPTSALFVAVGYNQSDGRY